MFEVEGWLIKSDIMLHSRQPEPCGIILWIVDGVLQSIFINLVMFWLLLA